MPGSDQTIEHVALRGVAIAPGRPYTYILKATIFHPPPYFSYAMSFKKFSWSCLLVLACTLLSGCMKNAPSQSTYEDYFRTSINDYSLYKDYFDIVSLKKVNGWKENEHYEIKGSALLRAKVGYLELLADFVNQIEQEAKTDPSVNLSMGVGLMARSMSGENKAFQEFWTQEVEKKAIPASLQARQAAMAPERFEKLLQWADQIVIDNYGAIISRQLKKNDELTRVYTLTFKQTEQGWMGFNAR